MRNEKKQIFGFWDLGHRISPLFCLLGNVWGEGIGVFFQFCSI
jgi:hypothetical protein